ncbi:ankyrin repeat-containing protein At5g02620-like isoform X1 [Fagus crenata]
MPPKRKVLGEIKVTTAHGPRINSTRQNSLSIEGTSFHQQPICNCNSSNHLSAVPVSQEIIVSTSILTPSIETITPQTSMIVTSDGAMPMQEGVRLDLAELSTQIPSGSQTEHLRPNGEWPYPILYDGERRKEYLSLCVPLYQAAIKGDWKAAKAVIDKDRGAVRVGITRKRETALHIAAVAVTNFESLGREEQISLLLHTISADLYDLALKILEKDQSLASARDANDETALHVLARKPSKIANKSQLGIWKRCINSCFKRIYHEDLMRTLAHQLVEKLWEHVLQLQDSEISKLITEPSRLLFDAAESGSLEFLTILIRSSPDLIWNVDENNRSLFHIAVLYRHETIFNLIYDIGAMKELIAARRDENNNNILHLAGNLAPHNQFQIVSGAALQMQRELLWFKAVEKIVPPSYIKMKNSDNQRPKDLFTEKHKDLLKEGENWMRSTATSCMLVATLIATLVFAAVFTLRGGGNNESASTFLNKKWFLIFMISDAVALFSSSASIMMFLSILTSRYAENDFLISLPARLMLGLSALFISIATMVLACGAAIFMIYDHSYFWVPIVIAVLGCVPVTLFAFKHFHLWADTIRSTYWSRFLFR